jgi:hypothetical protein
MEVLGPDNPLVGKKNPILRGYAAFHDRDWETLGSLLSPDVVWHPMPDTDDPGDKVGPEAVIAHLKHLRRTYDAEFLGMVTQGNAAVTLDFSYTENGDGDHGCADRIEFDQHGIREVWHCDAATHLHGPGEHP